MRKLTFGNRDEVYTAPTIPWNNDTYTPVSNKLIMDMIEDKLTQNGLIIKNQSYKTSKTDKGLVKGVIGNYDISTGDGEFGQRVAFRNSYDKSMSFAIVVGTCVWICENGSISGDYQYKRIHRGVITDNSSTTIDDIVENIDGSFKQIQVAFEHNVKQLNELKHFEVSPNDAYQVLGELFFHQEVINISQMSIIKKELEYSQNFRHLGAADFTAWDLYNSVTESLKTSHPITYLNDHIKTHKLFEQLFKI